MVVWLKERREVGRSYEESRCWGFKLIHMVFSCQSQTVNNKTIMLVVSPVALIWICVFTSHETLCVALTTQCAQLKTLLCLHEEAGGLNQGLPKEAWRLQFELFHVAKCVLIHFVFKCEWLLAHLMFYRHGKVISKSGRRMRSRERRGKTATLVLCNERH